MKLGSLCTGVGGLDLAVEQFFGAELAWCAEIDPAASRVLAARFPGVENIGNFVGQNPEPVDVLCGGFPCQPVSLAGKRAGTDDERWLFDDICDLVGRMEPRPRWLVFENVRGLLSANDGDAMARVVHGLARLGYVGSWRVVRASDVGAPHRRERVFIVAADGLRFGRHEDSSSSSSTDSAWQSSRPADSGGTAADAHGGRLEECCERDERQARGIAASQRHNADGLGEAPADADDSESHIIESADGQADIGSASGRRVVWAGGRSAASADAAHVGRERCGEPRDGWAGSAHCDFTPADANGIGLERSESFGLRLGVVAQHGDCGRAVDFGPYAAAVERWERLLGRAAPAPVDDRRRLNPQFVEWVMGFPAGWVTDVLDRRTDALRCLGNAVVPQQAMHALSLLVPQPELCATG